jgi:HAD superfamily phosphatase (TIGR01668 family)
VLFGLLDRLLTPRRIVRHVGDVTPDSLRAAGVRAVVTDLDNTLVPWHGEDVAAEVAAWLDALRDADMRVCIASNTRNLRRLERLAKHMDILHVPGNAAKPGRKGIRKALSLLGSEPAETAMVGDQLFTDIVAGNRLGLYTVLVNPLTKHEFIGTKLISRTAERLVLRGERRRAS